MDSGNINPNVTIGQSPEIKFNFSTQNNVLIIEALCSKDKKKYVESKGVKSTLLSSHKLDELTDRLFFFKTEQEIQIYILYQIHTLHDLFVHLASLIGSLQAYPVIDFQDIKEIINEGQFKVLVHNEEILKIKAGPVQIQLLVSKQNLQINELQEKLTKFIEQKTQMEATINYQKNKICILQKDNQQYKEKLQKLKRQHITEIDQLKKTLIDKEKRTQQLLIKVNKNLTYQKICCNN